MSGEQTNRNFAGWIADNCGPNAKLIHATSGQSIGNPNLSQWIGKAAAGFSTRGVNPGDRVLIVCELSPLSALAYLGAIYAGAVAVPIDVTQAIECTGSYAELTGASTAWVPRDALRDESATSRLNWVVGDEVLDHAAVPPALTDDDDLAALMSTSGTTGQPRFVKITHGNLCANTAAIIESQRLGADDTAMLILPISYCYGASVMHSHLASGGSVVFDSRFMFPDKVLSAIAGFGCTTFAGVPTTYQILLRRSNLPKLPMPQLRRFLQAGGPLDSESIEQVLKTVPGVDFFVMYGQTEATARITTLCPEKRLLKRGSAGRPMSNLNLIIGDDQRREVAVGVTGEIWVSGPSVSTGYWDDQTATHEVFQDGWLRTRDLGHVDDEGFLWIDGRTGDFLKIRGRRVSFGEVEQRVRQVPGVQDVVACAVPHVETDESLALFFVPEDHGDSQEISIRIRQSLPATWSCECIKMIDQVPLTERGKVNRRELTSVARNHGEHVREQG